MPRPQRIEYKGAFHHVMNRGRNHQAIYWEDEDYEAFLGILAQVTREYHAVIHAYCLMSGHYHLLVETPRANLSQIMKHVNGLYTQRYNRKYQKDGSLFRGRYQSILVDEDAYLLPLTRYIHRSPMEVKRKKVKQLGDYYWSSYPAYINQTKAPEWLHREKTYHMLGHRHRYKGYSNYVDKGIDDDIKRFYGKGNVLSVLGSKAFRTQRKEEYNNLDIKKLRLALEDKPTIKDIVGLITKVTKKTQKELLTRAKGKRSNFPERAFAVYVCHRYSRADHIEITRHFGLSHQGSLSHPLNRIRKEIANGLWSDEINRIEKQLHTKK